MFFDFICPNCGEEDIKEVVFSDQTESLLMGSADVTDDGVVLLDYERACAGGDIHGMVYECNGCGMKIADDQEGLIKWLREHGMLEE